MIENSKNELIVIKNEKVKKENIRLVLNVVKFILFDALMILIFLNDKYYFLFGIAFLSIISTCFLKISIKNMAKYLAYVIPIILLSFIINIMALDLTYATLIMTRFSIACICTYIFSKTITAVEISKVIETILSPLKLLKVDVKSIRFNG